MTLWSIMAFGRPVSIVAAFAVVSAQTSSAAAGGVPCTHPLFVNPYPVGNAPVYVAIGDLDGVNGPDLAVANGYSNDVSVLLNQGDGTLAPAVAHEAGGGP
ncbi:MAG: hypothetical protein ACYS0D_13690 [Planctomycetota bacterium]|jgi:hypothetical protein